MRKKGFQYTLSIISVCVLCYIAFFMFYKPTAYADALKEFEALEIECDEYIYYPGGGRVTDGNINLDACSNHYENIITCKYGVKYAGTYLITNVPVSAKIVGEHYCVNGEVKLL